MTQNWKTSWRVREFVVDTLFLGSLPYSGRDTTLTGSLHLTWGKRITQKSLICRQRRREPTGRKIATKRGNCFLNNNNVSMRLHASGKLSAVNLTKVASRPRRLTSLHHQEKRDWKARVWLPKFAISRCKSRQKKRPPRKQKDRNRTKLAVKLKNLTTCLCLLDIKHQIRSTSTLMPK